MLRSNHLKQYFRSYSTSSLIPCQVLTQSFDSVINSKNQNKNKITIHSKRYNGPKKVIIKDLQLQESMVQLNKQNLRKPLLLSCQGKQRDSQTQNDKLRQKNNNKTNDDYHNIKNINMELQKKLKQQVSEKKQFIQKLKKVKQENDLNLEELKKLRQLIAIFQLKIKQINKQKEVKENQLLRQIEKLSNSNSEFVNSKVKNEYIQLQKKNKEIYQCLLQCKSQNSKMKQKINLIHKYETVIANLQDHCQKYDSKMNEYVIQINDYQNKYNEMQIKYFRIQKQNDENKIMKEQAEIQKKQLKIMLNQQKFLFEKQQENRINRIKSLQTEKKKIQNQKNCLIYEKDLIINKLKKEKENDLQNFKKKQNTLMLQIINLNSQLQHKINQNQDNNNKLIKTIQSNHSDSNSVQNLDQLELYKEIFENKQIIKKYQEQLSQYKRKLQSLSQIEQQKNRQILCLKQKIQLLETKTKMQIQTIKKKMHQDVQISKNVIIKKLQNTLFQKNNQVQTLMHNIQQIKSQNKVNLINWFDQKKTDQKKIIYYKQQIDNIKKQTQQKIRSLEEIITADRQIYSKKNLQIELLTQTIQKLQTQITSKQSIIIQIQYERANLINQYNKIKQQIQSYHISQQETMCEMELTLKQKQKNISQKETQFNMLLNSKEELKLILNDKIDEIQKLKSTLIEIQKYNKTLKNKQISLEKLIIEKQQDYKLLVRSEIENLKNNYKQIQYENEKLRQINKTNDIKLNNLQTTISTINQYKLKVQDLQSNINKLSGQVSNLMSQIQQKNNTINQLKALNQQYLNSEHKHKFQLQNLSKYKSNIQQNYKQLNHDKISKDKQCIRLIQEINHLRKNIEYYFNSYQDLRILQENESIKFFNFKNEHENLLNIVQEYKIKIKVLQNENRNIHMIFSEQMQKRKKLIQDLVKQKNIMKGDYERNKTRLNY